MCIAEEIRISVVIAIEIGIHASTTLGIDTARGSSGSLCPGIALDHLGNHNPTCKRGGDVVTHHNHLRNGIVEFCQHAHFGMRVESGSGITPTEAVPGQQMYLSSIGRERTMLPLTSQ